MVIIVSVGQSIQAAVTAAAPGDTILVRKGTFNEAVTIPANKDRLRIVGEGPGKTILDGTGLAGASGFTIQASSFVTIACFTVRNFEADGIAVLTDDNVIRNNQLTRNGANGIFIDDGARNLIFQNDASENADEGIDLEGDGQHNYVIANRAAANQDVGIEVGSPNTLVLENEVCNNADEGILVFGNGSWVIDNRAYNNGSDGLDADIVDDVLFYGNVSTKNGISGLEVDALGLVAIRNKLNDNGGSGVDVTTSESNGVDQGLTQSFFYENEISRNNADGVHGRPEMLLNLFLANDVDENGDDGIDLDGGDANRLVFNDIDDNDGPGIDVDEGSNFNLIDVNFVDTNHGSGIRLDPNAVINVLRANRLKGNTPFDILAQPPAGTNNIFDLNHCGNSSPPTLCV